ncbi:Tetratricopeptide-like helical domain-containing protein, partial [Dioscorea alata]
PSFATYATRIFDCIPDPDIILCNAILRLYVKSSIYELAILFYASKVLARRFSPNARTFPYVSIACVGISNVELARQVHASVAKSAEVCNDVFMLNSLMDMYFKCGKNEDGIRVFGVMEKKDSISWNIMIAGLVNVGELWLARKMFDETLQRDVISWNTLVSSQAKAGEMETTRELFDQMPERSLMSWNALISGYSQNGKHDEALLVFS